MRNFRKIIFVLHFLVVVVLLPSNVFAEGQTASRAADSGHWIQRGSDYFWMQADGTILRKGLWQVLDGKRYYLAQNSGRRLSGWVNYSGNKYYLDPATGVLVTGLAKIDGYFYCFDESGSVPGRMLTGFIRRNEKRYYAPKSGRLVSGWQVINDRKYYFGKSIRKRSIFPNLACGISTASAM